MRFRGTLKPPELAKNCCEYSAPQMNSFHKARFRNDRCKLQKGEKTLPVSVGSIVQRDIHHSLSWFASRV